MRAKLSAAVISVPVARGLARDLLALFGFSVLFALAVGFIKTPLHIPGHAAIYRIPILLLAAVYGRPGFALGAASIGGLMARTWGAAGTLEVLGLLAAAAVVEVFQINRRRGSHLLIAGALAHLAKLGVKFAVLALAGVPLNQAFFPLLPTAGLYLAFGLVGGAVAWGIASGWASMRAAGNEPS